MLSAAGFRGSGGGEDGVVEMILRGGCLTGGGEGLFLPDDLVSHFDSTAPYSLCGEKKHVFLKDKWKFNPSFSTEEYT